MLLYSERKNMAKVTYGKQRDHDNFHNIIVERFDFDISLPRVISFPYIVVRFRVKIRFRSNEQDVKVAAIDYFEHR